MQKPVKLENINLEHLIQTCQEYIDYCFDAKNRWDGDSNEEFDHYIFEAALEAIFGPDIWAKINERSNAQITKIERGEETDIEEDEINDPIVVVKPFEVLRWFDLEGKNVDTRACVFSSGQYRTKEQALEVFGRVEKKPNIIYTLVESVQTDPNNISKIKHPLN